MVIVYTKNLSPRIEYTCRVIFDRVMGIPFEITTDPTYFGRSSFKRVNYSRTSLPRSLQIIPDGLLSEDELLHREPAIKKQEELPVLFPIEGGDLPFDVLSAVFYMVSRYEEYLPYKGDTLGRFEAAQSLALKHNFLHLPVVDLWCRELALALKVLDQCPGLEPGNYSFTLTIDIDHAWFYRHRRPVLMAKKILPDLLLLRWKEAFYKIGVIAGKYQDPGDSYDYLLEQQKNLRSKIEFFILCHHAGKYDKNLPLQNRQLQKLIRFLHQEHPLGIHPSFASNNSYRQLKSEFTLLTEVLGTPVYKSRQHYLMLNLPDTYRNLLRLGIRQDYSMGFAGSTGFRAGIARPFKFYDLYEEKETDLEIFPFQVMDRTMQQYMGQKPTEAEQELKSYTDRIRQVGGNFCTLWHNTSLTDTYEWKGWTQVFDSMIQYNAL